MPDAVKVIIVERNGSDLNDQEELDFIPANMPFSAAGFSADNVNSAIIEAVGVFGQSFSYVSDTSQTSTTSTTTYQTKLTLSPTGLVSGTYMLAFNAIVNTAAANRELDIRLYDSGTATVLWELKESIIRVAGSNSVSAFIPIPGISGSKTYQLQFKVGGSGTTAYCRASYLAIWRVA